MTADIQVPDEGLLQAYLDDELSSDDRVLVESKLEADPLWAVALDELKDASGLLRRGLEVQDAVAPSHAPPPWIGVLRGRVRSSPARFPLGRAAAVAALFVGAVASGLPGSPVRAWFADQFAQETMEPAVAATPEAAPTATAPSEGPDEVGVRVSTPGGSLDVTLPGLPGGTELWVRLDGGREPGVYGPTGTRFRTRDGRVEVLEVTGTVRIDLPPTITRATISVGDAVYLIKDGTQLDARGPVSSQSATEIRFVSDEDQP